MHCPERGVLRAYIDRELPTRQSDEVARHLVGCQDCKDTLAELQTHSSFAQSSLGKSPEGTDGFAEPALALASLRRRSRQQAPEKLGLRARFTRSLESFTPRRLAAAAIPAAIVIGLVATPMGSAAQDILNVFRVQNIQTVTIDTATLPALPEPEDLGTIDLKTEPKMTETTLAEASKLAGFTPKAVTKLPATVGTNPFVVVSDGVSGTYTYDIDKVRAYYAKRGLAGDPPAELDGLVVEGSMEAAVFQFYADPATLKMIEEAKTAHEQGGSVTNSPDQLDPLTLRYVALAQARSPKLAFPAGVDVDKLRAKLLDSGVLPPEIAAQLAAIVNWNETLPIPVLKGTSHEVTINGTKGVVIESPADPTTANSKLTTDSKRSMSSFAGKSRWLIWESDGILYGMTGSGSEADLIAAAASLR